MGEWAKRLIDETGARGKDKPEAEEVEGLDATTEGLLAMDMSLSMRAQSLEQ
jgi:hypothetical protein